MSVTQRAAELAAWPWLRLAAWRSDHVADIDGTDLWLDREFSEEFDRGEQSGFVSVLPALSWLAVMAAASATPLWPLAVSLGCLAILSATVIDDIEVRGRREVGR
jgi:hypothetical protein